MSSDWSSLVSEGANRKNAYKSSCIVAEDLRELGGEQAYSSVQAVIDQLYDTNPRKNKLNGAALLRSLVARGVSFTDTSLKRHIRKECACYRKASA